MKKIFRLFFILFLYIFLATLSPSYAIVSGPVEPFSFSANSGSEIGTVKITWIDNNDIEKYNLLYGTSANNLNFGVVDMGFQRKKTNEFTIKSLIPGQTYYFKLCGIRGGGDVESGPIMAVSASNKTLSTKSFYYSSIKNYQMPYLFTINYSNTSGSINVTWFDDDSADKYNIVYGLDPNNFSYGFQNMPYNANFSNTFAVNYLTPGKTYYFSLVAEKNNQVVSWTKPISITVK